ncbi:MAG: hypothetical protein ACM3XP_04940 [Nitrososphaerales archaeon]
MLNDPFAAYRPKPQAPIQEDQEDIFAAYRPKETADQQTLKEGILSQGFRKAGRSVARAAETTLGAPRAFGEFLESIVPEKALKAGAEKIGLGEPVEKALEITKKVAPYKLFPKSEDIRENVTKFLFGEKLEPKNEWDRKSDELISDFAALALPLPGKEFKLIKPALLALGGNLASELSEHLGGSKKEQTLAKLGTILAGSMINPKAAESLKTELYKKAAQSLPEDATVASRNLKNSVEELKRSIKKGGVSDADKPALKEISKIEKLIHGEQIGIDVLQEIKKKINIARESIYKQLEGNKPGIKTAKSRLDQVAKTVDNSLKEYGKQNPEWQTYYRQGNEVHGAIEQSKKARNQIGKALKKLGPHSILPLLGIGHFAGTPALAGIATTGALGSAALGASEIATKALKSPTLRKLYLNLIKSGLKEDVVAIRENAKKLERELEKED